MAGGNRCGRIAWQDATFHYHIAYAGFDFTCEGLLRVAESLPAVTTMATSTPFPGPVTFPNGNTPLLEGADLFAQTEIVGNVMYLVPEDQSKVGERVIPEKLQEANILSIGVTTDWTTIERLGAENKLQGVILHYEAISCALS